jgi:predicted Zn-dependent protease
MADSSSTTNWLQPTAADWIGLGAATMGAIITKGASLGESGSVSQEVAAAENAVNYFFGIVGGAPGVIQATATGGASKDGDAGKLAAQAFVRETEAATLGYFVGAAADALVGGILAGASITVGAPVVVAAVAIAAGYVASKYVSDELEKSDAVANAAAKAAAAAASSTANTDPISDRQYTLDDGSLCTVGTNGTLSVQTTLGTYQYDTAGNPFSFTDTSGISLNYNSATGQVTGVNTSTPLEGLLTFGASGIQITDQNTGINAGTLSLDSAGALQLSQSGAGTLTVPSSQSNQDISFAKDNGDGTITTTTASANGNSIVSTETDANGNILLTSITDISTGTNQSTTNFMGADGNSLGSLQTTSTVDANSTTTVSAQLDANGLLLGTTLTVTNNDGSSEVTSKDSQGNTLSEQAIASDGSAVITTFNSSTDPNLNSTVSKDSNGDISETSSTVAGDTPGSYVSTTLDANGALLEIETQTTDASGATDYQAYYGGGALTSTSYIAADGSRTETQYEDPNDPHITQSSHFDDNGDLVSQSSTQLIESNGSYLTTTTNPRGQTLSTLVEQADGSTTQTIFNNPNDTNLKTVIEDNGQGDLVGVSTTTVGTDSDYLTVRQNGDGETTGTDKTTITYDDQGQQIEHTQSYDANGVPTGTNDEVTSPDGHVSATINGTGVDADLNNATVILGADAQAIIAGYGDTIAASNAVLGISNSLGGADDVITGDNNRIAADYSAFTLNGAGEVVSGNYNTLSLGAGSSATLDSYGDVVTLSAGVNLTTEGGGGDTINASSDDTIDIATTPIYSYIYDTLNVTGDQNITLASGTVVNLVGSGNAITVGDGVSLTDSNDTINVQGTNDQINGSGDTIAASNDNLSISNYGSADDVITGDNNTIAVNDNGAITLNGTGEIVSGNYGTLSLGAGSSATLDSYGDTITLGAGVNLTLDGLGGNTIDASADDTFVIGDNYSDTLNVTDNQNITLDSGASVSLVGSGNAITAEGGNSLVDSNDTINVLGTDDQIIGFGDAIAASNDNLSISSYGGADDVISGDNNTIDAGYDSAITLDGTGEVVSGTNDTLNLGTGSSDTVDNSFGDVITLGAGVNLTLEGKGGDTINASADDTLAIATDPNLFYVDYSNTDTLNVTGDQNIALAGEISVNVVGSGNAITDGGYDILTASNDTINVQGTGDAITGSGDAIAASGEQLQISNSYGVSSDVVTGDNNTIVANDSAITLNGAGEALSGNRDTVNLDTGSSATLDSYGDVITLGAGVNLTSEGGGANTINAGADDTLVIGTIDANHYYAETPDTLNVTDNQSITLESDAAVNVVGSGNAITTEGGDNLTASNDTINVLGSNDQITGSGDAIAASGDRLQISNSDGVASDVVTGDNNTVVANDSAITLNGSGELVSGSFDTLALTGTGEIVSGSNDTLALTGSGAVVSGDNNTVNFGAGSSATVESYGDTITLGAGVNLTSDGWGGNTINAGADDAIVIGANGLGNDSDTLNVTDNQNITLDSGASVSVVGSGNAITAGGDNSLTASNDTISFQGNGASITGSGDTISANNESLSISNSDGAASDVVTGNNNTITAYNSAITFDGSGETLSGNNDAITVAAGEGITVSGAGDIITASSDQITLSGDNSSVVVQGNKDNFAVTGTNDRIIDDRADGTSVLYDWNGSGGETETVYSGADDTGGIIGGYGYTGTGPGADLPGSYGGGGYGGGYGFAGAQSLVSSGVGANIGAIAQYDLNHGNLSAAASAESAQQQAASIATLAPTSGTGSAVLEGAKWDQQVITWSLADSAGTQAALFSGYMGSAEESVVQAAFNTWASATPGVTFEEVADSAQSDIRVGFGDFNTATTGVVGYTSYQADAGQIAPDAIVRVEDTAQDALVTAADGQLTYSGSGASLSQVLLHEIGHALGLADNADQNSVMNYQLTSTNKTLDSTDFSGIGSLYRSAVPVASSGSGVSQLIQAMSTFNADAGVADTTLLPPTLANNNVTLSASAHAA